MTTSVANYMIASDPITAGHSLDAMHKVTAYLGTLIGAITLTGVPSVLPVASALDYRESHAQPHVVYIGCPALQWMFSAVVQQVFISLSRPL